MTLLKDLEAALGQDAVLSDPIQTESWGQDWTRLHPVHCMGVVFPSTAAQVAQVLKLCCQHRTSVVPSGGRTGLSGGAVATQGELVLNLSRLNRLAAVDPSARTVRAEAGVVHQTLQNHAHPHGLMWPIDLASKGSCQIGGNIATNAGGLRVIRYGHVRNWVQSLQVVLMSGKILELQGETLKNNTGYELKELMIGSEGTLGIITAATLKLVSLAGPTELALVAVKSVGDLLELLANLRRKNICLSAFEFFSQACLDAVCTQRSLPRPLPASPYFGLFEAEGDLAKALAEAFDENLLQEATLAQDASQARKLWEYREGITESLAGLGPVYKNDLALPLGQLDNFMKELLANAKTYYPTATLYLFGHAGDGNIHVNLVGPKDAKPKEFYQACEASNGWLFSLVQRLGGSIAAEHGIGLLKRDFLHFSRSPDELAIFRGIKQAFDPLGLLNPGKIF